MKSYVRRISFTLAIVILVSLFISCKKKEDPVESPSPSPIASPSRGPSIEYETKLIGTVTDVTSFLRVRAEPSSSGEVLGEVKNGQQFVVVQEFYEDSEWHMIEFREGTAFVHSDYLTVREERFEITP